MSNKSKEAENQPQKATTSTPETKANNVAVAKADTDKVGATKEKPKTVEEPKVSDAVVKIGKTLLKSNPTMSIVYMTSDGRGFYEKNDAELHARTLSNNIVVPVKK